MSDLSVPDIILTKRKRADDAEWNATLAGPLAVDTSEAGLGKSAEGAAKMPKADVPPPVQDLSNSLVRDGVDIVLKTMTGLGLDQLQNAIVTGTLPENVSLKIGAPVANVAEGLVKSQADRSGVDPSVKDEMVNAVRNPSGNAVKAAAKKIAEANGVSPENTAIVAEIAGVLGTILGTPSTAGVITAASASERARKVASILNNERGAINLPGILGAKAKGGESKVNTGPVNAEQSVKQTMTRLSQILNAPGEPVATARTPATHAQTVEAGRTAMTLEDAVSMPSEYWLLEEFRARQQALHDLHNALSTEVSRLKKLTLKGDGEAARELENVYPIAIKIAGDFELAGLGGGRAVEARKITSEAGRAPFTVDDIVSLRDRLGSEGLNGFAIARMLDQLPRGERSKVLRKIGHTYLAINDAFHFLFLQSLLSNPVTHAANVLGTGAINLHHYPERYVAEWVNLVFRKDPQGVQRGETWAMLGASGKAAGDAFRQMGKTWKTGEQPFGKTSVEPHFDITAKQFGLDPDTPLGMAADIAGRFTATRLMTTEDAIMKAGVKRLEISALALRQAMSEGLTDKDLARRVAALEANPTKDMLRMAEDAAALRTLNAELGPAGRAAMALRNAVPGGAYFAPFLRTPINGYKWFHQRAPGLSLLSIQNWQDILAGGASKDLAIARMLLGHALGGAVAYYVTQGNITGALAVGSNKNLNRDAKALGHEKYSICVGDEAFVYKRTDPIGQYIGAIATGVELYSQIGRRDDQPLDFMDWVGAVGLAGSRVALDTPFLMGIANVFDAIERPDVDGKKIAQGFARALVPAGVRQIATSGIPGIIEARPEIRELESLTDVIKSGIPDTGPFSVLPKSWTAVSVPPVLHPITGEPIVRPPGWGPDQLSPIYVSKLVDDPVLLEILQNAMNFGEPSKMFFGSGDPSGLTLDPTITPDAVRLNAHQYYRMKYLATHDVRDAQGRTMHEKMRDLVGTASYQRASRGPDGGREARLHEIYREYYNKARAHLRRDDAELDMKVRQKERERQQRTKSDAGLSSTLGR